MIHSTLCSLWLMRKWKRLKFQILCFRTLGTKEFHPAQPNTTNLNCEIVVYGINKCTSQPNGSLKKHISLPIYYHHCECYLEKYKKDMFLYLSQTNVPNIQTHFTSSSLSKWQHYLYLITTSKIKYPLLTPIWLIDGHMVFLLAIPMSTPTPNTHVNQQNNN